MGLPSGRYFAPSFRYERWECRVMHGTKTTAASRSKVRAGRSSSEQSASGKSASDDGDWFAEMAQALLGKPGLELSLLTGFDESLCYKYAKGAVRPPAYFLRALLRSERGEVFLRYALDGVPWWRSLERNADLGRSVLEITKR